MTVFIVKKDGKRWGRAETYPKFIGGENPIEQFCFFVEIDGTQQPLGWPGLVKLIENRLDNDRRIITYQLEEELAPGMIGLSSILAIARERGLRVVCEFAGNQFTERQ